MVAACISFALFGWEYLVGSTLFIGGAEFNDIVIQETTRKNKSKYMIKLWQAYPFTLSCGNPQWMQASFSRFQVFPMWLCLRVEGHCLVQFESSGGDTIYQYFISLQFLIAFLLNNSYIYFNSDYHFIDVKKNSWTSKRI
jgi:hypothetical protein